MRLSVDSLKPGMVFSKPVFIEDENILVPGGVELRDKDIQRIVSWGIRYVETNGELVNNKDMDIGETEMKSNETAQSEAEKNQGVYGSYIDFIERLDRIFSDIGSNASMGDKSVDEITSQLLQAVQDRRNSFIGFILGGEVSGYELAKSSINTAILSSFIAVELKLPDQKVKQVVTGALLHDVGMLRLPYELVHKRGRLSSAETEKMQAHSLYAYKIISKELLYPEDVGIIALQHHERWDGEGYPRKLIGTAINIGARIVSVADAFEAMVSEKPYRNSMVGYQAMKNLLSDNSRRFDPDVLKAFIRTMGIYPIGSIILLNNGAMARVIDVQGMAPLRPRIQILIDENRKVHKQDEGEFIDLLNDKRLFIARAVDPKELSQKNA